MKLLISLVLALTVQGEVFEPASESSTTPEIAEKSAKGVGAAVLGEKLKSLWTHVVRSKGEDEENHLHDLIANPEDEEGAKATTEMAGGVGAAVLGEKLKSLWTHVVRSKGEDEENHLHDLIANPEDEEGAKATTEMAGGVGAAVLGEKLKSLRGGFAGFR